MSNFTSTSGSLEPRPLWRIPIASAMRRVLARGYHLADFRADLLSGTLVGIVALPLSMALAIAVGVAPQHGLYTAIIAGALVALLGGSKFQVTGPTAAFVVVLAPITSKYGTSGLFTAGAMAGVLLIVMGVARLGVLIRFIPHPVTTGFTTGIATVIAVLQVKDVLGLETRQLPDHFLEKVGALFAARGSARWQEFCVAVLTFTLLTLLPRRFPKLPAPLLSIAFVAGVAAIAAHVWPSFSVDTIGSRFHTTIGGVDVAGIPNLLPVPGLPWGADGLSLAAVRELASAAVAIALLGAIESLLSATIADSMTNTKHDPNAELLALGVGNLVTPFFGGIPATGALARTATNVRAGARSPISAAVHSLVVLLSILVLSPLLAFVPMAALAALLLRVAWTMSEAHNFVGIVRVAPKSDVIILLTCYGLTVVFDMVIAVSVGVVLAAFLFMRRMAELTQSRLKLESIADDGTPVALPPGVLLYEISGPLFFGAAQSAMNALQASRSDDFRVLILHLGNVPVIDATGLTALENAAANVLRTKKQVILAGPLPKPQQIFDRARLETKHPGLRITATLEEALSLASEGRSVAPTPSPAPA